MMETPDDIEFETRPVGPLVLTIPSLRHLGPAEIVDRLCPALIEIIPEVHYQELYGE
jgi:hypothetical protein